MATSGSSGVNATSHDSIWFNWSRTGYSIPDNYTDIYWELVLTSDGYGAISSTASKSWNVTVNGSYYEGTNTVGIGANGTKILASGTTRIYHNSDGSKQFSYSYNQYFGITFSGSWVGTIGGSGSAWLDTIPRKATFKSVSSFNDVTNPTIYFDHPAGSALDLQACITSGKDSSGEDIYMTSYRILSKDDIARGYYTFNLKEDYGNGDNPQKRIWDRSVAVKNDTIDITFHLATWVGVSEKTPTGFEYSQSNTVKCTVTDCEPTLNPTVVDIGSTSTKLTGDGTPNSNTVINGYNCIVGTFNDEAKKGARIVSRSVKCGNQNSVVKPENGKYIATFDNVEGKDFLFIATDNRGKTVERTVSFDTLIPYTKLTCNTTIDKDLKSDNTADININVFGKYYNGSFGAKNNNLSIEYRYKSNDTDYPVNANGVEEWISLDYSLQDADEYVSTGTINISDYKKTYTIQIRARDEAHTDYIYAKAETVKIVPTFDWGENDFNFNVPIFKEGNPVGYHPIGGIFTSTENVNPGELFGGTWQLMRTFYGGELVAYGSAWNSYGHDVKRIANTYYGVSDVIADGYTDSICNYVPGVLTGNSGTIWVQTKGIVGLVEANFEISGSTDNSGCYGIWFGETNKNTLPANVTMSGGKTLHTVNGYYAGNSTRYFYKVSNDDAGSSFFVNPTWTPYGGDFYPCHSGTRSILQVKAFAKGGTTYMWKRTA